MHLDGTGARAAVLATLAAGTLALSACGSPGPATASGTTPTVKTTCQNVSAVLSDGPDSGADPVGYAEAQIKPLRQIHTGDKSLQSAVNALASAYQQFYNSNGGAAARQAVSQASHNLNRICPGAAS